MKVIHLLCLLFITVIAEATSPVKALLERIDKGASDKFLIEQVNFPVDFFELDQKGNKVVIRGNNPVNIATGLNWYLKYYAGIHLSWNGMQATLPEILPAVTQKERHETEVKYRYDFNYCTYSYTMAFWDWERWEKEIDWMALHGINLPLAMVGTDGVWYNVLKKLGYSKEEIDEFIAGPGFQAWWLMNNLEGWGGPNSDNWYKQQIALQQRILKRMREYGIEPVLPGYSGMVPHNAKEKLGLNVSDPGLWCDYRRPAFLLPTDPRFHEIASLYYKEMNKLYGKANFYSMDPFHEGGSVAGVNLDAAGKAIMQAMKKNNPKAVWVAQAWQANPRSQMIENLKAGDMIVLDLFSESRPQWGDPKSTWYRKEGFGQHDWIYCMLLNYGGNIGLHGKMNHVIDEFYKAKKSPFGKTLKGVGMTMEGSENNPVMFELLTELPWRAEKFDKDQWIKNYTFARYGKTNKTVQDAWILLSNSIYNCPSENVQQGTHESIFCARPSEHPYQVSSWSEMEDYYDPEDVIHAAAMLVSVADQFKGINNFEYDLVDIARQAIAEKGRRIEKVVEAAYISGDKSLYRASTERFLALLLLQDELLGTRPEFRVGNWIRQARSIGNTPEEKDLYEWNARVQITTWGNRNAANNGGLRDYAHKEWNGILKDFYYMRWKTWFDHQLQKLEGNNPAEIDFYALEEPWTKATNFYTWKPEGDCIPTVKRIFAEVFE
ncbi:alpha-N-acetylglucosaminidase [Parabacteroides faecis]|uniref:Alpha-N-acetylglucosaminidase n=1 Tax=Parabacteroides faecis TaxID=1217282 RepID=A0ABR6KL06_9BACT|nr:alpha-N-acetylglucosaminidase [Parabacteroides faecis]MBB4622177.1 alpha-N-acetylglucosaminidase [Parabacteroides faecis]GGJ80775.1 alpha-N-acetylglucosaminidase [Parabacteroides faecis]